MTSFEAWGEEVGSVRHLKEKNPCGCRGSKVVQAVCRCAVDYFSGRHDAVCVYFQNPIRIKRVNRLLVTRNRANWKYPNSHVSSRSKLTAYADHQRCSNRVCRDPAASSRFGWAVTDIPATSVSPASRGCGRRLRSRFSPIGRPRPATPVLDCCRNQILGWKKALLP